MTTGTMTTPKMTANEFYAWSQLPENELRRCELINGKVIDVPSPGVLHGIVAALIARILLNYAFESQSGVVTSNDSGLAISENMVLGPDLMFFLGKRSVAEFPQGYSREVPLLCVEILSPSNRMTQMIRKVNYYHRFGVKLVWIVDPEERSVHVFRNDELPKLLDESDTLSGNGILPEFSCAVADLFRLPGTVG